MPLGSHRSDYSIECTADVRCIEFSPFEWSQNVLLFVSGNVVCAYNCRFVAEAREDPVPRCDFKLLSEFNHTAIASSISISPESTLNMEPWVLRFCTSAADGNVRIFTSDVKKTVELKLLSGHVGFVNSAAFDRDKGLRVASVGDDCTCRLWDCNDGQEVCIFPLRSAGVAVLFHASDNTKMLVGEKSSTIRLYNIVALQPVASLTCGSVAAPLRSVAWHPADQTQVYALAGPQWLAFDMSRSSLPYQHGDVGDTCAGRCISCASSRAKIVATVAGWGAHLRVFNVGIKGKQSVIDFQAPLGNGVSWHNSQPVLALGGDKKVHLFFVNQL